MGATVGVVLLLPIGRGSHGRALSPLGVAVWKGPAPNARKPGSGPIRQCDRRLLPLSVIFCKLGAWCLSASCLEALLVRGHLRWGHRVHISSPLGRDGRVTGVSVTQQAWTMPSPGPDLGTGCWWGCPSVGSRSHLGPSLGPGGVWAWQ